MKIKEMLITPNKWSRPQTKIGTIKNIVVHWVGNAGSTAENNAKYFDGLKVGKKNSAGNYILLEMMVYWLDVYLKMKWPTMQVMPTVIQ